MNKRVIVLLGILGIVGTIFSINLYQKSKKELFMEFKSYKEFEKKVNQILALKNKYKTKINLKCKKEETHEKIIYECKNLTKQKFQQINNILKRNIKINKFKINKDKTVDFTLEIFK